MTTTARRPLKFESLHQVMPDVDRLLQGHRTVGNWSLAQICNHLTVAIVGSVEGYPKKAPWLIRKTLGPFVLKRLMKTEQIDEGMKTMDEFVPKPGLDSRAEAEALRGALRLFAAAPGPMAEHSFFGTLSRDAWDRLHRVHCAHHLSFALPEPA
jgi:Protein of unknown function (DUF1569)